MRRSIAVALVLAIPSLATPAASGDCPGAATSEEFACFTNSGVADLVVRLEWPDGRWAVHAHPAARKLRLHIGPDDATACWSANGEAARAVTERCGTRGRAVMKGCDGSS